MRLLIQIPGPPVPKGRPRVTRRGTYTPSRTAEYEARVREAATDAIRSVDWPTNAEYRVRIAVYRARKAGDAINFGVSVCDALEGVCYVNDRQIAEIVCKRFDGEEPRTLVDLEVV